MNNCSSVSGKRIKIQNRRWTNVLYQAHYYDTNTTNYAEQSGFIDNNLADMDSHRQMWNVPVYAGEYNYWLFLMYGVNG